jgi:hypothetical protein
LLFFFQTNGRYCQCAGKYELRASNRDMKVEVKGSTQV